MKGPWFIETLARNGDVLHRHRVDSLPIRIGRGYDNDYILDDAYAAPYHAQVEAGEDGTLLLRERDCRVMPGGSSGGGARPRAIAATLFFRFT